MITLNRDFREFIELLEKGNVEYLVVGGYAVALPSFPRFTGDIDFIVAVGQDNAEALVAVFKAFGFGGLG